MIFGECEYQRTIDNQIACILPKRVCDNMSYNKDITLRFEKKVLKYYTCYSGEGVACSVLKYAKYKYNPS